MLETIFQMIAPHYCAKCNALGDRFLCEACVNTQITPPIGRCYRCNRLSEHSKTCRSCRSSSQVFSLQTLGWYENPLKELIHTMKFSSARSIAGELAETMCEHLPTPSVDAITYVPTDPSRVRSRGFDHAKLLAGQTSRHLNKPMLPLLRRTKHTKQVGASRFRRHQQMKAAFSGKPSTIRSVLLIDDVVSTGATIEAAAQTLRKNGVSRVYVWAVCRNR